MRLRHWRIPLLLLWRLHVFRLERANSDFPALDLSDARMASAWVESGTICARLLWANPFILSAGTTHVAFSKDTSSQRIPRSSFVLTKVSMRSFTASFTLSD